MWRVTPKIRQRMMAGARDGGKKERKNQRDGIGCLRIEKELRRVAHGLYSA